MRSLILAIQFLTRLPTPRLRNFDAQEMAGCLVWFPWVGVLIGAFVTAAVLLGSSIDSWLGALLGVLIWTWITGGLHLDGLADLSDALGAAHRDPNRFLQVMSDPHVGAFGVLALIAQLLSKLVLLRVAMNHGRLDLMTLPLICAWSRFGAAYWSQVLPSLPGSSTERFVWRSSTFAMVLNVSLLASLTVINEPLLLSALLLLAGWQWFLRKRVGGMSGDCLGAGIELTESALLLIHLSPGPILAALLKYRLSHAAAGQPS
jgi:adenosylcobinamide-GDP ribazoletransferase